MASVRLEHVSKQFDDTNVVVKDADFTINDKEFVVLVGPSGCGKSTTLRMIAGLEGISKGNIYIEDRLVNDVPPKDRDIAMVFQNYALYPHMTVFENLAFGLRMRKYPKTEIKQRVDEAALILDISELIDRKPKALSGGQRQRVALGRAIVRRPKVFLFDEPLSNLDANLRVQMRTEISRLHKRLQTTMIYVTHDQVEAMSMGDRIVVMKGGVIQQIDTPLSIYNKPTNQFVASFIGSPTMNFFNGRLTPNEPTTVELAPARIQLPASTHDRNRLVSHTDQEIVVGIRPEHISAKQQSELSIAVPVKVDVTEPVGNEIFVYFTIGDSSDRYVSRIPADVHPEGGKTFNFYFDAEKLHFFSKSTGNAL